IAGNGFCGCSRKTLLQLLHQRCREEGVGLHFEQNIDDVSQFKDSDMIVASDGIASTIRTKFQNELDRKSTRLNSSHVKISYAVADFYTLSLHDALPICIAGNGFCGCSRKTLLQLLHQRCREEGVGLHFEQNIDDVSQFKDSDMIVASDGIASTIRTKFQNE